MKREPSHHTDFAKWILAFEGPDAVPCLTAEFSQATHYNEAKRNIESLGLLQEAGGENNITMDVKTLAIDVKGLENCVKLAQWLTKDNKPLYDEELIPQGMKDVESEWLEKHKQDHPAEKGRSQKRLGSRNFPPRKSPPGWGLN